MKKLYAFTALAALLLAGPAFAATASTNTESRVETDADGGYTAKEKAEITSPNGTVRERTTTKTVDIDRNGARETKVKVKSSTDPKGLFNKTSTETVDKETQKDGKIEYKHKKTVDGKTVEEEQETRP